MRILLVGADGRMGKEVLSALKNYDDVKVVAKVDKAFLREGRKEYTDIEHVEEEYDGIIDFSTHNATVSTLKVAIVRRAAAVICTTGHGEEERKYIEYASQFIPVFYVSNTSLGIAILKKQAGEIARSFPSASVEIVEIHHLNKADVPSGTALAIAQEIKNARGGRVVVGRRPKDEYVRGDIGIHSLRMGEVKGRHEVIFDTGDERICLSHEVFSRSVYARGAIEAARFLSGKDKGLFGTEDLF